MNKTKKGSVLGIFLLVSMLVVGLTGVASAFDDYNSQTWDFNNDNEMYKPPHSESGTITIGTEANSIWTAEHDAEVDVGFSEELWNGQIEVQVASSSKMCTVEVGIWTGSTFQSKGTSSTVTFDSVTQAYSLSGSAFTVPTGQWLAARVTNTGTAGFTLVTDGSCFITYPFDEPDYPVPELPTIILMSAGLLALFGYVVYRRRNNKSE
ncbi:MAG: hypothetical protein WA977_10095 [Halobacteriota archaeon]